MSDEERKNIEKQLETALKEHEENLTKLNEEDITSYLKLEDGFFDNDAIFYLNEISQKDDDTFNYNMEELDKLYVEDDLDIELINPEVVFVKENENEKNIKAPQSVTITSLKLRVIHHKPKRTTYCTQSQG